MSFTALVSSPTSPRRPCRRRTREASLPSPISRATRVSSRSGLAIRRAATPAISQSTPIAARSEAIGTNGENFQVPSKQTLSVPSGRPSRTIAPVALLAPRQRFHRLPARIGDPHPAADRVGEIRRERPPLGRVLPVARETPRQHRQRALVPAPLVPSVAEDPDHGHRGADA